MNDISRLAAAVAAVSSLIAVGLLSPSPANPATGKPFRQTVTEDGVRFALRVPGVGLRASEGWAKYRSIPTATSPGGPISLNRSITGPQGAEAIIYWTSFPHGDYANPCVRLLSRSIGRSAAKLAAAVATAPGTELVKGPSSVTLDGHSAKYVVLTVRKNVGCDPGFFFSWRDVDGGPLWPTTKVGDTIRAWIVKVDGTLLFIAAATTRQASAWLTKEAQQIVESIRFGQPPRGPAPSARLSSPADATQPVRGDVRIEVRSGGAVSSRRRFTISGAISDRGRYFDTAVYGPARRYDLVRKLVGAKGTIWLEVGFVKPFPCQCSWRISKVTKAYTGLSGRGHEEGTYGPPVVLTMSGTISR